MAQDLKSCARTGSVKVLPGEGRLGLSLSGGGFRATVFHLGVLARLAEESRLEDVAFLSTVSGGSLCIGLVYSCNGGNWPSSREYIDKVLPAARAKLTATDLQGAMVKRMLHWPLRLLATRADDLSLLLRRHWGVSGTLQDLPEQPRWIINATCYETGKNFRFERHRMGDYMLGYTSDTDMPLSDALAASAAFPGLVGPLPLRTRSRSWFRYAQRSGGEVQKADILPTTPPFSKIHLWDGGVYDNLGMESMHNFDDGWRKDVDFLIVSDGCQRLQPEIYRTWKSANRLVRGIMMDQVRSLRYRAMVERKDNHGDPGCYVQIGSSLRDLLGYAGTGAHSGSDAIALEPLLARRAGSFGTHIRRLTYPDFDLLFRHGFEVANCVLHGEYPSAFSQISYGCAHSSSVDHNVDTGVLRGEMKMASQWSAAA